MGERTLDVRIGKGKEASEIPLEQDLQADRSYIVPKRELLMWRVPHAVNVPSVPPASERASERLSIA